MAEAETQIVGEAAAEEPSPGRRWRMLSKLLAVAFMVVVVVVECIVVSVFLSNANESLAEAAVEGGEETASEEKGGTQVEDLLAGDEARQQVEVDLYQYNITATQAAAQVTLHISFHLYGTVNADERDEFLSLLEGNEHRFRDMVISTVRSADVEDLTDPGLGLIKRKILTTTNRTFGKHLLKGIIFSEFSFYEQ